MSSNLKKCDIQWCIAMVKKGEPYCPVHRIDPTFKPGKKESWTPNKPSRS